MIENLHILNSPFSILHFNYRAQEVELTTPMELFEAEEPLVQLAVELVPLAHDGQFALP